MINYMVMSRYFKYINIPTEQIIQLLTLEPKLVKFINADRPFSIRIMPDHFTCIVHTIISQQFSSAVVDAI
jgi:3-methyladenine DNA glycosylase/8-oxoguanine DNA glycosylase